MTPSRITVTRSNFPNGEPIFEEVRGILRFFLNKNWHEGEKGCCPLLNGQWRLGFWCCVVWFEKLTEFWLIWMETVVSFWLGSKDLKSTNWSAHIFCLSLIDVFDPKGMLSFIDNVWTGVLYEYASDSPEINCWNREEKSVIPEFAEDRWNDTFCWIDTGLVSVSRCWCRTAWLHCRLVVVVVVVVGNVHMIWYTCRIGKHGNRRRLLSQYSLS